MKKLLIMALCLMTCVAVFATDASSTNQNTTLNTQKVPANVTLDLNSDQAKEHIIGFTNDISTFSSDSSSFGSTVPETKDDYTLVVADINNPKGTLGDNMYIFWKITYPEALYVKLSSSGPMISSSNKINWQITVDPQKSSNSDNVQSVTIGGTDKYTDQNTVTYDNENTVYSHPKQTTILRDHGYAKVEIITQNLDGVTTGAYEGTLNILISTN